MTGDNRKAAEILFTLAGNLSTISDRAFQHLPANVLKLETLVLRYGLLGKTITRMTPQRGEEVFMALYTMLGEGDINDRLDPLGSMPRVPNSPQTHVIMQTGRFVPIRKPGEHANETADRHFVMDKFLENLMPYPTALRPELYEYALKEGLEFEPKAGQAWDDILNRGL